MLIPLIRNLFEVRRGRLHSRTPMRARWYQYTVGQLNLPIECTRTGLTQSVNLVEPSCIDLGLRRLTCLLHRFCFDWGEFVKYEIFRTQKLIKQKILWNKLVSCRRTSIVDFKSKTYFLSVSQWDYDLSLFQKSYIISFRQLFNIFVIEIF